MNVENLLVRAFFETEKYQSSLIFIESKGEPPVWISTFYANKGHLIPWKKHFLMPVEVWKCFKEAVRHFDDDGKRGAV